MKTNYTYVFPMFSSEEAVRLGSSATQLPSPPTPTPTPTPTTWLAVLTRFKV